MKKVILFGGSFDPIHNGHLKIAKTALKQRKADELWFVPTKMSPFKEDSTEFFHRYTMIERAISSQKNIYVSDVENHLPAPSYSIDTFRALSIRYPNTTFEWLIGSDQLPRLSEWKDFKILESSVQFIVYRRGEVLEPFDYPEIIGEFLDISSTSIRNGESSQAPASVLKYFTENALYLPQRLRNSLSKKRYEHVIRVTNLAESLALHHNIDVNRVRLAALAHDMHKETSPIYMEILMKKVYPQFASLSPEIYHAFAARHELSTRYYIKDKTVLDAVCSHVIGSSTHPIAKILYIADKCEPGRAFDTSDSVDLAFKDLNLAFKKVKKEAQKYVQSKGIK